MSRYFRLLSKFHSCKLWSLEQDGITPALNDKVASQLENFPEGFWKEVWKCKAKCGSYVDSEGAFCDKCLVNIDVDDIDMSKPIIDLLPELRKIRDIAGQRWTEIRAKLHTKEEKDGQRETILNYLKE